MKKNYTSIIVLITILCFGILSAQEAQKNYINYQGVARNGENQLMSEQAMTIGIGLKMGSATATADYAENHSITTDANGVFSLKIGNGEAVSGDYNNILWGSEATFVTVLINGSEIGTTEMMAVPYALSSGDGSQSASEVPYNNADSGLAATNAQEAIDELVGSTAVDADADPANEIQHLTLDGTNLEISNGTGVDLAPLLPAGGTDDQNASEVSFDNSATTLAATDTQSAIEELATGVLVDTDDQNLSLSGTLLQISDGVGVDLALIIPPGGSDDQNAGEVPYDNTTSPLVATNTQDAIDELAIGTVGGSSLWEQDGADLYYDSGNVGIGTIPQSLHHVHAPSNSFTKYTIDDSGSGAGDGLDIGLSDGFFRGPRAQIINNGSGLLTLGTNGVEELFIDAIQGVITRSDLKVDGVIESTSLAGGGNVIADAEGNLVIGLGDSGSTLWTESGSNIYYSEGLVGIGTASPNVLQHVHNGTGIAGGGSFGRYSTALNNSGLLIGMNDSNKLAFLLNIEDGPLHLGTKATPQMTISNNGDIGIGTQTPTAKLDVEGDIKTSGEINGTATGDTNMMPIAYGLVSSAGDVEVRSGSGNFTVHTIATPGRYFIAIEGTTLDDAFQFTIVATRRASGDSAPGFIETAYGSSSGVGAAIINTYDLSGNEANSAFSFCVYRN